jgi:hypothetical protein
VDLVDFNLTGIKTTFSNGILQLSNASGQLASLDFQTSTLGKGSFHTATDGAGGVLLTHS